MALCVQQCANVSLFVFKVMYEKARVSALQCAACVFLSHKSSSHQAMSTVFCDTTLSMVKTYSGRSSPSAVEDSFMSRSLTSRPDEGFILVTCLRLSGRKSLGIKARIHLRQLLTSACVGGQHQRLVRFIAEGHVEMVDCFIQTSYLSFAWLPGVNCLICVRSQSVPKSSTEDLGIWHQLAAAMTSPPARRKWWINTHAVALSFPQGGSAGAGPTLRPRINE